MPSPLITSTSVARQRRGSLGSRSSAASDKLHPTAWPARPTVRCGTTSANSPCQGGVSKWVASSEVKRLKGAAGSAQPQHPLAKPADRFQAVLERTVFGQELR